MKLAWPETSAARATELDAIRKELEAEKRTGV